MVKMMMMMRIIAIKIKSGSLATYLYTPQSPQRKEWSSINPKISGG
jgi:hypothetical protein